jgi:hypothetical protein
VNGTIDGIWRYSDEDCIASESYGGAKNPKENCRSASLSLEVRPFSDPYSV